MGFLILLRNRDAIPWLGKESLAWFLSVTFWIWGLLGVALVGGRG